ncbi:MAG: EAL domain-containing protein [Lachnospiraceae bacterium]|nr:EAL domain-containing protein [Lachnospiraceae bacterium]
MNVHVQCCGIILLIVLLYFYSGQRKVRLNTERAFLRIYISAFINLILDISSIVAITYRDTLPDMLVELVCKFYVMTLVLVNLFSMLYVCADIYVDKKEYNTIRNRFTVFSVIGMIFVLILPIYINAEERNKTYTYGLSVIATYISVFVIIFSTIYLIKRYKSRLNQKRRESVLIWFTIWIVAAVIQFIWKELLIVGYAGVVGVLIIYLKLENPALNIDRRTGLFTQNAFGQLIRQMYGMQQKFSVLCLSCIQKIKGRYNADVVEMVLLEVAEYISELSGVVAFKNPDDELLLIIKDQTNSDAIIAQIQKRFREKWGEDKSIRMGMGAIFVPMAESLKSAEDVLYLLNYVRKHHKERNENKLLIIDEEIISAMYREKYIEKLLVDAIDKDKIEVFYQPIYSTEEKQFVSAEALARIRDEDGRIVPPGEFIEIAEQSGHILELGKQVFEHVCRFIRDKEPQRFGIQYLEVNLSVVQCGYEYLADSFIRIMEDYSVNPKFINLEITESASMKAKKTLLSNMKKLMEYGVTFSLDDFGTGQSNLNYIVDMPVEIVKFDKSMIDSYFENHKARYVMDAAMHMIHGMKLCIVSEGIETEEQFETMEKLGINYIQGYYFSKPIPEEEFLRFIEKRAIMRG